MINNLKALILVGGKSSRMGTDKSQLKYGQFNQVETLFRLLNKYCDEVYVSCREDQKNLPHLQYFETITDKLDINSPSNGIVSALKEHPYSSFLVVAVDLPLVNEQTIEKLINERDPVRIATCYKNPENNLPEPLCAIWEAKSKDVLEQYIGNSKTCPRKVLINSDTKLIEQSSENELFNANNYRDYKNIVDQTIDLNM